MIAMESWLIPILVAALTGGGVAAILNALNARRKAGSEIKVTEADAGKKEAETADIITNAAGKAAEILSKQICKLAAENETMQKEIEDLKQRIIELEERFDEVLTGAHVLYEQVVSNGLDPKYKPPERRKRDRP